MDRPRWSCADLSGVESARRTSSLLSGAVFGLDPAPRDQGQTILQDKPAAASHPFSNRSRALVLCRPLRRRLDPAHGP
jgi:hypothetical protein